MIKRKEIEEVTRLLHEGACIYQDGSYPCPEVKDCPACYLNYLHSQGVVIKVECPVCRGYARPNKVSYNSYEGYVVNGHSCPNCNNAGYVAVEPLVKEV